MKWRISRKKAKREDTKVVLRRHLEKPDIHVVFHAKYSYLAYMRDLCASLASNAGFNDDDTFDITLAFDEILANAFEHGCRHPSDDNIDVKISLAGSSISVYVRDPGGKSFDYNKYKGINHEASSSIASGLCLVDKFADRWAVETEPDEYTEVMFSKRKSKEEEK